VKIEELLKLVDAIKASDLSEFNIETADVKMTLRRASKSQFPEDTTALPPVPTSPAAKEEGLVEVLAPLVGTFYQAPSPDAKPFVGPGSTVLPGDTLCILEAMKLMNEIEAEMQGQVVDIVVKDGDLVEYGQVLMTLRPVRS
jgi:acetyl-CoA carboxylase biotin carboxyl carrier protein